MFIYIKKIVFSCLLLILSHSLMAGFEGTWRFTPVIYSVTANGVTQSWTLDQYLAQFGQFAEVSKEDFIFEQEYSDAWLTPQTFSSNEGGVVFSSTITHSFSSDSTGSQVTDFISTFNDPTTGQSFTSTGRLEYSMAKISDGSGNSSGNTTTNTPTIANTVAELPVSNVQGTVFEITPTATSAVDNIISDNSTIFTSDNASLEVNLGNNNKLTVEEKTVVTLSPAVSIDSTTNTKKASLVRGSVDYDIQAGSSTEFELNTPIIKAKVLAGSSKRVTQQTNFTVEYSQSGNTGTSTVKVNSGSVQVTNRNGNTVTLSAGQEQTFSNQVFRTTWVQPADSAFLFGGATNTLAWTNFSGAIGYVIEYTFPSPSFSEENPSSMEFPEKKVLIPAANFQIVEDIVVMEMALPASLNGLVVEARLFPVDGQGNILNSSVASDKGTFGFQAK